MANRPELENLVRGFRLGRGWSQDDLARRSGLSRTGISAIESGRLVPSTTAALSLALAFSCKVEELFSIPRAEDQGEEWALAPPRFPCRYWRAEVGRRIRLYPVEAGSLGLSAHDGVASDVVERVDMMASRPERPDPRSTLVIATCDPAIGLLAQELNRASNFRVLALRRSSRKALELLKQGVVHAAGLHLGSGENSEGNIAAVREILGGGHHLIKAARWEEGVAIGQGCKVRSIGEAVGSKLRWVGREEGSGARECLDELLGPRTPPRHQATDHQGVAEALRAGWADLGVCLRLTSEESGLGFLKAREESYDLAVPDRFLDDPRLQAMLALMRSQGYRRLLGELPGYQSQEAGEVQRVI